jgi:hypothetical protein
MRFAAEGKSLLRREDECLPIDKFKSKPTLTPTASATTLARQEECPSLKVYSMTLQERRRHTRTEDQAIIGFGFLNQTPRYIGFVANTSKYGIYFTTEKLLTVGTLVTIQPWRCGMRPPKTGSPASHRDAADLCARSQNAVHRLKTMVTAKIVHCRRIEERVPPTYGIGAQYEGPAV